MMIGAMHGINVTGATSRYGILLTVIQFLTFSGMFGNERWEIGALGVAETPWMQLKVGQSMGRSLF
jgi:hypothetical protein